MTCYNIALLSLLVSTASAVPHYGQYGHRHPILRKSASYPSGGVPSGFPTAGPTAPYGQGNSTTIAPTGSAPVSSSPPIFSTVTVVPQPIPSSSGSGNSPVESSSGSGNSPIGGTSAAGGECGPATVTVTSANTVTVTVGAGPESSAPVETTPIQSPNPTSSAPYGNGTTSAPIGTGTAPIGTGSIPIGTGSAPIGTGSAPIGTGSAIPETSLPVIVSPSYSTGNELTSVAHPIPLASSTVETSLETTTSHTGGESYQAPTTSEIILTPVSSTVASSPEQATTSHTGGDFYQASTTPEVVPTPGSSTVANSPEQATTSSSTQPKSTGHASSDNVVPRGLVYNEASLTSHFETPAVGWLYNWDSAPGGTVDTTKEFVPMLWNTSAQFHTGHWESRAEDAIAAGTKHLLAFNEPDLAAQANMNVGESVEGWLQYIEPFHSKYNGDVKLGSPSVCNGPDANQGLQYLKSFLDGCGGCHVDFLAIHWYGLATDDGLQNLKDHIGKAQGIADGRPIWLTEFKPDGSDEDQAKFLGEILPWLDDKSNGVDRYAYFQVDTMVNGDQLTKAGATYAT
ncbi:MAG: hypothetical protein Q9179_002038 [Wetmoreana sp. 5 TL-2023]